MRKYWMLSSIIKDDVSGCFDRICVRTFGCWRLLAVPPGISCSNVRRHVGEIVGVDYDGGAAAFAGGAMRVQDLRRSFCRAPAWPKASFDVVCAFQTLEHVPEPVAFASELARYLRPGGILVIEVPNPRRPVAIPVRRARVSKNSTFTASTSSIFRRNL